MIPCPVCKHTESSAIATYEQWAASVRRKRDMRSGPLARLEEWKEVRPPAHIIWYDRQTLDGLLKRHGFTSTSCWPSVKPTLKMIAR